MLRGAIGLRRLGHVLLTDTHEKRFRMAVPLALPVI